jgi:hypothetical protein
MGKLRSRLKPRRLFWPTIGENKATFSLRIINTAHVGIPAEQENSREKAKKILAAGIKPHAGASQV